MDGGNMEGNVMAGSEREGMSIATRVRVGRPRGRAWQRAREEERIKRREEGDKVLLGSRCWLEWSEWQWTAWEKKERMELREAKKEVEAKKEAEAKKEVKSKKEAEARVEVGAKKGAEVKEEVGARKEGEAKKEVEEVGMEEWSWVMWRKKHHSRESDEDRWN